MASSVLNATTTYTMALLSKDRHNHGCKFTKDDDEKQLFKLLQRSTINRNLCNSQATKQGYRIVKVEVH